MAAKKRILAGATATQPASRAVSAVGVRFCRAGMCFTQQPTIVELNALNTTQWQQLAAEPHLLVEEVAPVNTATLG